MKPNYKKILIYIILSIILTLPLLTYCFGIDDIYFHYRRIQAITSNIRNGIFEKWIYTSFYDYGYASGIFYPDIFILPFCLLTLLHVSDFAICIIIVFSSVLITFFITEYFTKKILINYDIKDIEYKSILISIFYSCNPKMISDIFVNQAINRIQCYMFIPILVYAIYCLFFKRKKNTWILLSISITLLLYNHLINTFILCLFLIFIYIINIKKINKNIIIDTIKAAILTLVTSSCIYMPIIEGFYYNDLKVEIEPSYDDIAKYSPQVFSTDNIFIKLIFTIVVFSILIIFYKKKKSFINLNVCIIAGILIMCTNIFPWELITKIFPIFNTIQFATRFLLLISVSFAIIMAYKYKNIFPKIYIFAIIISSVTTFLVFSKYNDDILNNKIDEKGISCNYGQGEYLPYNLYKYIDTLTEEERINFKMECHFIKDEGILNYQKTNNKIRIDYSTNTDNEIIIPMYYYYGYKTYINNQPCSYQCSNEGFISISVEEGNGTIELINKPTTIQNMSVIISICGWVFIFVYIYKNKKSIYYSKK